MSLKSYELAHSLIQLGSLLDKAGLLNTFGITLGLDLQRDPEVKMQMASLFKGLTMLNEMAQNPNEISLQLWAHQGLQLFGATNRKKSQ